MNLSVPYVVLATSRLLVGLSAGFFLAYTYSVTRGLALVDDVTYVQTFQAINETIRSLPFGIIFFGPIVALGVTMAVFRHQGTTNRALAGAALVLYLTLVGITFAGNVPLNEELADRGKDLTPVEATEAREEFEDEWNRLNLIRSLAVLGSFGAVLAVSSPRRPHSATTGAPDATGTGRNVPSTVIA